MSVNALPTIVDTAPSAQNLRDQTSRRSEHGAPTAAQSTESSMRRALEALSSISNDMDALGAQIRSGEPPPRAVTLRSRIGSLVKRRLYGFLWWQSYQIKTLAALTLRLGREEMNVVDALGQSMEQVSRDSRETRQLILAWKRQVHESDTRLTQIESAHSRVQAAEIEQNARNNEAFSEVKNTLNLAAATIADLSRRLDLETAQKEQLATRLSELQRSVQEAVGPSMQAAVERSVQEARTALTQEIDAERAQRQQIEARLSELGLFTHSTRASLSIQDRRLGLFIEEARQHLPGPIPQEQVESMVNEHIQHRYDSLYAAFEDALRGTREEIKTRQSVYLPLLKDHGIGSPAMPLVDLGCGRGEWLELLGEQGLQARGVDRNDAMVERCASLGLQVVQGDALPYLASLPDACLGAITSFHMVEHMPLDMVLSLVDESLRVLKRGGILILETPNPQNILVGAYTFFFDPTHLKPLPSPMLRFFVEARGFCDAQVLELQPYPDSVRLPEDGKGVASRLNYYFYGPQDYAVIGRRP